MGWGSLALGEVDVYEVPCRHGLMFSKPQIQVLAEQLTVCLERAATAEDERHSSGARSA